jgi:hypothetical protein
MIRSGSSGLPRSSLQIVEHNGRRTGSPFARPQQFVRGGGIEKNRANSYGDTKWTVGGREKETLGDITQSRLRSAESALQLLDNIVGQRHLIQRPFEKILLANKRHNCPDNESPRVVEFERNDRLKIQRIPPIMASSQWPSQSKPQSTHFVPGYRAVLRDKDHSPIEAPRTILSLWSLKSRTEFKLFTDKLVSEVST